MVDPASEAGGWPHDIELAPGSFVAVGDAAAGFAVGDAVDDLDRLILGISVMDLDSYRFLVEQLRLYPVVDWKYQRVSLGRSHIPSNAAAMC